MISVDQERDKYTRMWAVPGYHRHSPGEALVRQFLNAVEWRPGDTLIDLGAGTGRAGKRLAQNGLLVFLFDLVNAVEPGIGLPFINGNLWDIPRAFKFDWIYCTDVLEHIPPEHVDATLDGMADITRKGGFLQIAHFADGFGKRIGETLHLTLQPPEWWRKKISERWPLTRWEFSGSHSVAVIGQPFRSELNADISSRHRAG